MLNFTIKEDEPVVYLRGPSGNRGSWYGQDTASGRQNCDGTEGLAMSANIDTWGTEISLVIMKR